MSSDAIEADEAGVDADLDIGASEADAGWYRDDAMTNNREGCETCLVAVWWLSGWSSVTGKLQR